MTSSDPILRSHNACCAANKLLKGIEMKKMVLKSIVFTVALCGAGTVAAIMAGASMKPKAIVDLNPDALAGAALAEVQE